MRCRNMTRHLKVAAILTGVGILASQARAEMVIDEGFDVSPTFQLDGAPLGKTGKPAPTAPASLAGSTITALDKGALALDEDSGQLIKVDAKGKVVARVDVAPGATQMVYDESAEVAYVADRQGDRIHVVSVGKKLEVKESWETPTEPYGLALSPDGKTLLVTTVADRTLVAFDTSKGKQAWTHALSREPRGVAISPDGTSAMVGCDAFDPTSRSSEP